MALFDPLFLLGITVTLYLSTFVIFAVTRILTGVSVQRLGYLSLRHLSFAPRDGIKLKIRGLGLDFHRPTFSQPTWISIVITQLVVSVNLKELENQKANRSVVGAGEKTEAKEKENGKENGHKNDGTENGVPQMATSDNTRSATWQKLTLLKERVKKLHRNVRWIQLVDIVATDSAVHLEGVGKVQLGNFTITLDTRNRLVDRARFFFQSKVEKELQTQSAEWIVALKSVLFTAEGSESIEVLDSATLNVHGFLYDNMDGLRDATVALKFGRVHVPYDDVLICMERSKLLRRQQASIPDFTKVSMDNIREKDDPSSTDSEVIKAISDSKEFVSSILRGIKEVQFAVSLVSLTKKVLAVQATGSPVLLNASMKEVGIDLHRLDPKSPAHRMYFPSDVIAHEALAAALSISVGLDDGQGKPTRIVYVPMATTTVKTTLPSKTVEFSAVKSAEERNANILFANSVVTSPCIDLDPKHLPVLLALLRSQPKAPKDRAQKRHMLLSRLLPKATIKFSMHEPIMRVTLPPVQKTDDPDDFDLIISSISSISLDVESSHSAVEESLYSLASSMRIQSHHLYYRTSQGVRFDLLDTDAFDLKLQLSATPDVHVVANGHLQTFAIRMTRPEITKGIRQIIRQLKPSVEPDKRATSKAKMPQNILRALPPWFLHFSVQVDDFSAEITGVDDDFPELTRGIVLQVDTWSAEYRAQRMDHVRQRPLSRRRAASRALVPDPEILNSVSVLSTRKTQHEGDGRRVEIHMKDLEAFVMEAPEKWEAEPFIQMPRFELAFSTHSNAQNPILHVHSQLRTLLIQYSLFRHYSVGVAVMILRRAFAKDSENPMPVSAQSPTTPLAPESPSTSGVDAFNKPSKELVTVDCKAALIQIKAEMPEDPPLMLQVYGFEAGRQRWLPPYFGSKLIRLYAGAPRMPGVWARVASLKSLRLDVRESRKKTADGTFEDDKMVDVVMDAIRIAVPHELIIHKISDNLINIIKASEQLHHRFKTGTNDYILEKGPEKPKNVPKVSLRARNMMFELEDGAFEWKLGMIYRAGRVEQQQRIAREDAFRVKVKKIQEEMKRDSDRIRNRSVVTRGRGMEPNPWGRSKSEDRLAQHTQEERSRSEAPNSQHPRYNPDDVCELTGNADVSIQDARNKLHELNAQSWKKRIDSQLLKARQGMQELRSMFWGSDDVPDELEDTEKILEVPQRPALMATIIHDLHIIVDKPSFPTQELPDFLHKVGKGMPKDMKYSLLVPMNIQIAMGEVKVTLRDYPLPLLHVPALRPGQSSKLPALSLKSDFVIAEEYRGREASRKMRVQITPPTIHEPGMPNGSFAIDVRRTIGPVKSYSDIYVYLNTANPTRITWGPSYQPAMQDMMMVIESFTKPQLDTSERVGFWDKIRLSFHSRLRVAWTEGGDVHLALKGSRDPYSVVGDGAGFLMCWRNNVKWNLHTEDDPMKFMIVDSGEFVLAVPDYSHYARDEAQSIHEKDNIASDSSYYKTGVAFKKVIMKLSGNIQWMAGLVFERAIVDGKRDFTFKPHYEVILKAPNDDESSEGAEPYDAFRGFRSQHIHLSIAVKAPMDRDWTSSEVQAPSRSYNTIHLTPRFFTHFFAWWSLFSGPMSLPIRQGSLWPGREKNSKKFGRHLGTIKYNILLAPLFLSHIYKHKDAESYSENDVSATGIKVRFDSFMLDIHQRREEFNTQDVGIKTDNTNSRTTGIKIHAASLDLQSVDVRAVSASIRGTTTEAVKTNSLSTLLAQHDVDESADLSNFTIPDNDYSWIDMDDFVELDWILPSEPNPDTKILPLAYSPRVTYFRQTDIGGTIDGDPDRTSPFGNEPTHFCIMSEDDDPRRVQSHLIQARLDQLDEQISSNLRNISEAELRMALDPDTRPEYETLNKHTNVLREKHSFMASMLREMAYKITTSQKQNMSQDNEQSESTIEIGKGETLKVPLGAEFASDFKNRFVVHNMQLKWNNLLRNIIIRYSHQVSQRRGFVYYLSRPAVKFIIDMVEEQMKAKQNNKTNSSKASQTSKTDTQNDEANDDIEHRIKQILKDGRKYVNADKSGTSEGTGNANMEDITGGIAEDFAPQNSFHVRLIAPQIQLQSDKNKKHAILVTAKGMELKIVEVMEKARLSDPVSGLVQRRFLTRMDSAQFFVTHQKWFSDQNLSKYSGNSYGTPADSSWPPWVPMEVMFDFHTDPFGFKRIVQKTSAMLRYDTFNTLRLKYNDEVNDVDGSTPSQDNSESRMDNLWVEFPQARALCNSSQYYAMYVIVLDLLLYSEPLEKTRNERLEKIMLASDFSNLRGTPEMVIQLQERIRNLEEIKSRFQIHSKNLDRKGWEDRLVLERDLAASEDELFFLMKAITSLQRRRYDNSVQSNALLKWTITAREIVWHLIQDNHEPLVELQLKDVEYDRIDNSDGSHINLLQIGKILGLNLMPNAIYPEMIAPYIEGDNSRNDLKDTQMIRVYFHMLEAIAGIPVMDHFEVNLFPMKIQLEREVGKKLFQYIFPEVEAVPATDNSNVSDMPSITRTNDSGVDTLMDEPLAVFGKTNATSFDKDPNFDTEPGSLELRLRPTLTLDDRPSTAKSTMHSGEGGHMFRLLGAKQMTKKPSYESLRSNNNTLQRPSMGRSPTMASSGSESKKGTRFPLPRKASSVETEPSDDLSKMLTRASSYMTFVYIKMPSVVLCLSYKGKGERNIEDVHDFVFRLPAIEYRNRTWSNLDLAMNLKAHTMRALISHTGAIISNKFSKHRPTMAQQSKLRELATSSVLLAAPPLTSTTESSGDDSSSFLALSPVDYSRSPPRSVKDSSSSIVRPSSRSSSITSSHSIGQNGGDSGMAGASSYFRMMSNNRTLAGLGIDAVRPKSSSSKEYLEPARPSTSGSILSGSSERKAGGTGFLRGKFTALTGRRRDRDGTDPKDGGPEDEPQQAQTPQRD